MSKTSQKLSPELVAELLTTARLRAWPPVPVETPPESEETAPAKTEVRLTLKELAAATELTERTIRYYIQQGVLPPPNGAGPASYYGIEHLTRLSLVRRFKAALLPLARIKELLAEHSLPELEQVAEQLYNDIAHTNPVPPPQEMAERSRTSSLPAVMWVDPNEAGDLEIFYPPEEQADPDPASTPPRLEEMAYSGRWNRITLVPGLELHYQEGGPQDNNNGRQKLAQLVELALRLYQSAG